MALKRTNKREATAPVEVAEETTPEEKPLRLIALHHDWYDDSIKQRFVEGVPTEPVVFTQWLQCQVDAGNMRIE